MTRLSTRAKRRIPKKLTPHPLELAARALLGLRQNLEMGQVLNMATRTQRISPEMVAAIESPLRAATEPAAKDQQKSADSPISLLTGDCLLMLKRIKSRTMQSCVTSAPRWRGASNNDEKAPLIGEERSPDEYVENLVEVFREVWRTMADNGALWLNVGDGYARGIGDGHLQPGDEPNLWGLKDHDLLGLPWRVAFALQESGWILRSNITWIRRTPASEDVWNRPTNATEELFLLTKSARYFYDNQAVREESGANLRNYWILGADSIGVQRSTDFPRTLARRCVLLTSHPGDVILDPFSGSGTTGVVAASLRRRAALIEQNPKYAAQSKARILSMQRPESDEDSDDGGEFGVRRRPQAQGSAAADSAELGAMRRPRGKALATGGALAARRRPTSPKDLTASGGLDARRGSTLPENLPNVGRKRGGKRMGLFGRRS